MNSEKLKITIGYIVICMIWGSTWLAIRIGLESLTPMISAGIRFSFASFFIFILIKLNKIKLQTDPLAIKLYFISGFFSFVIPFGLVYWAGQFVPSGLASILFGIFPIGVLLLSRLYIPGNKIIGMQAIGVVLGFLGIIIIFSDGLSFDFSNYLIGIIAVVMSALMQAAFAVIIKRHGGYLHPLSMNLIPLLIAGIVMIIGGLLFEDRSNWIFDTKAIGSALYLAFFGTVVTFTIYFWLMKKIDIVILALSSFITPIVAVFLGWIIMDELLSFQALTGSALVLIGILFANFNQLKNYIKTKKKLSLS